ncbi:MAG: zinc ABC transporter substrate-binding protein [Nitrospirae bacterium]|nr:zinc ABC transporter substrate-binding protein [Nitrospirota bacterium]
MQKLSYNFLLITTAVLLFISSSTNALAGQKIKVVTTLTFLEDFVKNVGGSRVEVKSLLTGLESEHTYTPKPSDIASVRDAKVLVKIGLGLEIWVDSLIKNASNNNLMVITTSSGIPLLRNEEWDTHGHDAHAGNPHIWLDPERAKVMIRHITDALIKIDPEGRKIYLSNQSEYFKKIDIMRKHIENKLSNIPDRKIITHHPAWPYFAQRFKLIIADNIQIQVGSEPSAKHVAAIINKIRQEKIRAIVSEPQLNPKTPKAIADETGAKLITLTPVPGGLPGTGTYIEMMEYNGEQLVKGLSGEQK